MPVITVTGLIGSGGTEVGSAVAHKLGVSFVDRLILAEAAKKMGTTLAAVADLTERAPRLGDRVAGFVRTVLERSALAGSGADPYFGGGLDALLVREYRDFPEIGDSDVPHSDSKLLEVTTGVIQDIAASGNVVISGRGANVILRDRADACHIALTSSMDERIKRIMDRVDLERREAERYVVENDKARNDYYQRFFHVHPEDLHQYHMVINTDWIDVPEAARLVIETANIVTKPSPV
jgi:cytidylate kinase